MRAIEIIDTQTVLEVQRENKFRKYPTPEIDRERLRPFAKPVTKGNFKISKHDKIFALGSCFARNIEQRLTEFGFDVLSDIRNNPVFENTPDASTLFNKYTIKSIQNELECLLPDAPRNIGDFYYQFGDKAGFDFQLGASKLGQSVEDFLKFRQHYSNIFRKLSETDVVILTLGYVELWYDTE